MLSNTTSTKKQTELSHIQDFLKCYLNDKYDSLKSYEGPDFLLNIDKKQIGIELTTLYYSPNDDIYSLQAQNNWQKKVIKYCNKQIKHKYNIYVSFEEHSKIDKNNFKSFCNDLMFQVQNNLKLDWPLPITIGKSQFENWHENIFQVSIYNKVDLICPGFIRMNCYDASKVINLNNI